MLKINGLDIEVSQDRVIIYDVMNDVSPEEGEIIVKYLFSEGFINCVDVSLEIVKDSD